MFITRWRVAFEDSTVPLDGRAARVAFVLDLEPRVVRACTIGRIDTLRHDAFAIAVDDRPEERLAVRLDVLDHLDGAGRADSRP